MNQGLSLILLLSSTLCLGQSVLTTPGSQTPSAPGPTAIPRDIRATPNSTPTEIYDLKEIVIPTKFKSPSNFTQQLPFYTQILSSAALTGATISTIH